MTTHERGTRRVKRGIVASNKMNKTLVVHVERKMAHPLYGKVVKKQKKYYAHDENAHTRKAGDQVTIVECRPISKLKRWRVIDEAVAG